MPPLYGAAFVGQGDRRTSAGKKVRERLFSDLRTARYVKLSV